MNAVAVSPDGRWLATGGEDGTVRIWETATGRAGKVLAGHEGPVNAVAVSPDGRWLATGGEDRTVRIWETATGYAKALMRVENSVFDCTWLGNNGLALAGQAGVYWFDFLANTE